MATAVTSQGDAQRNPQPHDGSVSARNDPARLTDILSAQVAALEAALREADARIRQAETKSGTPRHDMTRHDMAGPHSASEPHPDSGADSPHPGSTTTERDRVTVLCYAAEILLNRSLAQTIPPTVTDACNRLAPGDPAREHYTRVCRFFDQADLF